MGEHDRSCGPTPRPGPGCHFMPTASGGHTRDPHFTNGKQVRGCVSLDTRVSRLPTSKPPRPSSRAPQSGDECAVWSRCLSQLGPAAQSLSHPPGVWGPAPALPLQGTEPEAPPRPGSRWENGKGTSGSCPASSVASQRSEPQFPQLKSGQPAHVAGKGGAGEGRQGRQELSGHRPPCDVTDRVAQLSPAHREPASRSAAASLGAATSSWRESSGATQTRFSPPGACGQWRDLTGK